jgi:signal peptide peptidase SppA
MSYERVARAALETPWFIREAEGRIVAEIVLARLEGVRLTEDEVAERVGAAEAAQGPRRGARMSGAVAVLPVYGVLMPRANLMAAMSGGTTVESLRAAFREVMADEAVGSIVFDVDSPGGAVDGIEELATEIREARGRKPMVAVANTLMASAAYYLASQADEVVASPSSMLGSIGVFLEHVETSRADDADGITTTVIRRPDAKHEANMSEPLSDTARTHLQQVVDDYYGQFVGAVAKGRGVTPAAVREGYGQGRVLTARRAVAAGLADRVGTLDEAIIRLATGKAPTARVAGATWHLVSSEETPIPTEAEIEPPPSDDAPLPEDQPDRTNEAQAALALARANANRR